MPERRRQRGQGDIRGPAHGDFTDWDNPEDEEWEDAPEGYYDDEEETSEAEEFGPDDPDYDLSETAGYAGWEPPKRQPFLPRWVIVAVSMLLILALLLPVLRWLS